MIKYDKIHVRVISGYYQRIRGYLALVLYGTFFLLPWVNIAGRQSVLFDFVHQKFFILNAVFFPKDLLFLTWGLMLGAFFLFAITNILGRVWCGFACPQTIWTLAFIWVENKIEGSANTRAKWQSKPLRDPNRVARRVLKHLVWALMAIATGATFVAYFYPAKAIYDGLINANLPMGVWVGGGIFAYLTYLNAGLLREKVCLHMCPYSRFQSVMYDADTIAVAYDPAVGEPRRSLKQASKQAQTNQAAGGCIDCSMCVQVCPTGIDIREGSQIDCINCGLCIDACDSVMASIGRPPELITFTSQTALAGGKSSVLRPRSVGYFSAVFAAVFMLTLHFVTSSDIDTSIVRERDRIVRYTASGDVTNAYLLKLKNKAQETLQFDVEVKSEGFRIISNAHASLSGGERVELPIVVASTEQLRGSYPVQFVVKGLDATGTVREDIHVGRFVIADDGSIAAIEPAKR
ncbi:Uncharacterised protein [BD1-7 clade bacterium]|uniref:4Fe-4S ferredoxin-type domain-containing protein n=1 Tax=BD1-7 clade bacterium TaxID=2029982 RepID=A0A5S9QQI3_9GAMM|nr:Uncharacterised protein [BD1-7 clade bacterium]CAA0121568.1 Uncharacterised protein [BD1-7 clade bacterium]